MKIFKWEVNSKAFKELVQAKPNIRASPAKVGQYIIQPALEDKFCS